MDADPAVCSEVGALPAACPTQGCPERKACPTWRREPADNSFSSKRSAQPCSFSLQNCRQKGVNDRKYTAHRTKGVDHQVSAFFNLKFLKVETSTSTRAG